MPVDKRGPELALLTPDALSKWCNGAVLSCSADGCVLDSLLLQTVRGSLVCANTLPCFMSEHIFQPVVELLLSDTQLQWHFKSVSLYFILTNEWKPGGKCICLSESIDSS